LIRAPHHELESFVLAEKFDLLSGWVAVVAGQAAGSTLAGRAAFHPLA
jgi:hypothetical protein